jgi:GNAT superfamily N-acetyltransferase
MVGEWDPRTAPAAEIEAVLGLVNAVLVADLPDDPPWRLTAFREYLAVTMPSERRICWLARDGASGIQGAADVLLLDDIAVLEIHVHPSARRRGVGRRLLAAAVHRLVQEGLGSVGVEVIGDTPAVDFYEALGFRCAYVEIRNLLQLSNVDWGRLAEMAAGVGAGYRIEYYPGGPPEALYQAYASAKEVTRGAYDAGDLDLRPSSYEPERLKASVATLHARGMKPYIVLGVHEPTGQIAGLTEVVVPAQHPTRADQYDTVVVPAHRGYGLGRALKARMLFELRSAEPQLIDVQTWNAFENEPLLRVNAELGFEPDRQWREYEIELVELKHRLAELDAGS